MDRLAIQYANSAILRWPLKIVQLFLAMNFELSLSLKCFRTSSQKCPQRIYTIYSLPYGAARLTNFPDPRLVFVATWSLMNLLISIKAYAYHDIFYRTD